VSGLLIYEVAIRYVDGLKGTVSVKDLFLDMLPVVDLRYFYIYGITVTVGIFVVYLLYFRPDLIPFSIKFFCAVFILRSLFICLTHLGPPEGFFIPSFAQDYGEWPLNHLMHSNDLFFSGHVAYPFMAALVTSHKKALFTFFLSTSVVMGITVLLMRIHYSIDVFAAYFIVYGLYHLVRKFFGKTDLHFYSLLKKS
jgi:hypothetical protein